MTNTDINKRKALEEAVNLAVTMPGLTKEDIVKIAEFFTAWLEKNE